MWTSLCVLLSISTALTNAQFYFHQPSSPDLAYHASQHYRSIQPAQPAPQQYEHPSVVDNAWREEQLPPELRKSDRFYKNPRIAAALAKESWFTDQEAPVLDREAEKIPRDMVLKLFKNAGWIKRR